MLSLFLPVTALQGVLKLKLNFHITYKLFHGYKNYSSQEISNELLKPFVRFSFIVEEALNVDTKPLNKM